MKAEINDKNKAKFFAQYWNQKVIHHSDYGEQSPLNVGGAMIEICNDGYYLLLKSLYLINDEDAELVIGVIETNLKRNNINDGCYGMSASGIFIDSLRLDNNSFYVTPIEQDYLRLKGYAVNWMGLSVNEMIQAGWIKLIES